MRREIPWNWFRPGPEREAALARDRRRREAATPATRARAEAEGRPLTRADRDEDIRRLWSEGWGGPELAARFGVAPPTVSRVVSGLPPRPRPRRLAERDAEIRRLWGLGFTGPELSERFGLAKSTLSGIVKGMPHRRRYGDPEDVAYPFPRRLARALEELAARYDLAPSGEVLPPQDLRQFGSANGRAKLVEADVSRMHELKASGWSYKALAREFKISRSNVWYVLSGTTWKGVAERGVS